MARNFAEWLLTFTDRMGWYLARNNLRETFDSMDNIYNINDMKNGVMREIFNAIVDYVIVGGYDENGKLNKVLRNGLRIRVECDIT